MTKTIEQQVVDLQTSVDGVKSDLANVQSGITTIQSLLNGGTISSGGAISLQPILDAVAASEGNLTTLLNTQTASLTEIIKDLES